MSETARRPDSSTDSSKVCDHSRSIKNRLFCSECGRLLEAGSLKRVRLMGPVGVAHSNSRAIDMFYRTGDPAAFSKPGDPDYTPGVSMG